MNDQNQCGTGSPLSPQLALLFGASTELLATKDPLDFIEQVYARLAALLGVEIYVHFVVSTDRTHLTLAASSGFTPEQQASLQRLEFGQAVCGTVARTCKPMNVSDVQQSDDPLTEVIRSLGMTAYVCHPLIIEDELFGTLSFGSRKSTEFAQEAIELIRAVSDLVAVAITRCRAEQSLRDADRRKDEFLALLAHELRNPLAPIRSGVDILRADPDAPGVIDKTCKVMERQIDQLTRLVDDLMQVSRIGNRKLQLSMETVELSVIVDNALAQARSGLEKGGRKVTLELPDEPVFLHGDPVRLSQVLGNLLDNAAKYTPAGGHIFLIAEKRDESVSVCVRDDGVGIPPEKLRWIFEPFHQIEQDREPRGLGLGLSLVKSLVEMHGGTVEARSKGVGEGSEFVVTLSLLVHREDAEPLPRHLDDATVMPARQRHRVLVVDDNEDAARMLAKVLEALGQETRIVFDGLAALEMGNAFRPQIVLLDIGMPNVNGYEIAQRIRREPWGENVLLAALTGWSRDTVEERLRQTGFDFCLTKPASLADLKSLLDATSSTAEKAVGTKNTRAHAAASITASSDSM